MHKILAANKVPAQGGRRIPFQPPSPPQLPLSNRYRALECDGQAKEDVGEGPSRGLPRTSQSAPCITTALVKEKKGVIVIGDSLLKGTEGTRYADQTHPTGKSAASLGPRLEIFLGSSQPW